MLNKKGVSIISLTLCFVAFAIMMTALVIAKQNYDINNYNMQKAKVDVAEQSAYTKVYMIEDIKEIAKQSYVDNYLDYFEKNITISELEARIMQDIQSKVPSQQLSMYNIFVYNDGVMVEYK